MSCTNCVCLFESLKETLQNWQLLNIGMFSNLGVPGRTGCNCQFGSSGKTTRRKQPIFLLPNSSVRTIGRHFFKVLVGPVAGRKVTVLFRPKLS